jgi:hypothetical protein
MLDDKIYMNNTKTKTLAIVAILTAATLVVGTFATIAAADPALAYAKKGARQDGIKDKARDDGSGNTDTAQIAKQYGIVSGFDNLLTQETQNGICTHPGDNATCVSEGGGVAAANGGSGSVSQACIQTFTNVLGVQLSDFINGALSVFPSPPRTLTVENLCALLLTGTITEQLFNRVLIAANIDPNSPTALALKSGLAKTGIRFAIPRSQE